MPSIFHVKGRLVPYGDSVSEPVEFEVQAERFADLVERLLSLGASIHSSGFENVRNATVFLERAGLEFSQELVRRGQ